MRKTRGIRLYTQLSTEEGGDALRGAAEGVDAPRAAVNDLAGEFRCSREGRPRARY
jgi:hypothetical protein